MTAAAQRSTAEASYPAPAARASETEHTSSGTYPELLAAMRQQWQSLPSYTPIRLAKSTSNVFRLRAPSGTAGLDVSGFRGVLSVDPVNATADVLGMTTYEELVDATLPHGLMPLVVPQLKTITLGGAVTGLGIESTSFRDGLPHESVREMDVLTGTGDVVTATPDNEHADLFYAFPNSYGTLGYALRLTIDLAPVKGFVELRHIRFHSATDVAEAITVITHERQWAGQSVDFLDGTVFSPQEIYLTLGRWTDQPTQDPSDYTGRHIFYQSIRTRGTDVLTTRDYIWRWDTDWFWCSAGLGLQKPWVRAMVPRRYLRSDVYHRVVGFGRKHHLVDALARVRGRPAQEYVIQDIEVPVAQLAAFLDFFDREVGIKPVWLCPLQLRSSVRPWDLYPLDPATIYVNVGFWSSVPIREGAALGDVNRAIEAEVERLGGRKSLYSDSYYSADEFWRIYGGATYERVKKMYDPGERLLDLYEKCVGRR